MEDQEESESMAEIWEWEQKLQNKINKVTRLKYKEVEQKKPMHFDIFNMKLKNYNKEKEQMKLRKEEYSKQYEYRKLRALYGTRISSRILRGVIEDKEVSDESM